MRSGCVLELTLSEVPIAVLWCASPELILLVERPTRSAKSQCNGCAHARGLLLQCVHALERSGEASTAKRVHHNCASVLRTF